MKKKFTKIFNNQIYTFLLSKYKAFSRRSLNNFLSIHSAQFKLNENIKKEILLVGSGGKLEKIVRDNFICKVVSIDIDPSRSPDIVCDISDTAFSDSSFDIIIALEVFEHIKFPDRAIKEIYRLLKPRGSLLLSVPFIFPIHDEPFDFQRWTLQGVRLLTYKFKNVQILNKHNEVISMFVIISRLFFSSKNLVLRILGAIFILLGGILPLRFFLHSKQYSRISTGYLISAKK